MHKLTDKQAAFVCAYTRDTKTAGNGTASAIAAGYSARSAHVIASQLLKVRHVALAIERQFLRSGTVDLRNRRRARAQRWCILRAFEADAW